MFFPNKYMADPKACRLEISGPSLRFVVRPAVHAQTGIYLFIYFVILSYMYSKDNVNSKLKMSSTSVFASSFSSIPILEASLGLTHLLSTLFDYWNKVFSKYITVRTGKP